jgi:hypothetical protein
MIKEKCIFFGLLLIAIGESNSFSVEFKYADKANTFLGTEVNEQPVNYKIKPHIYSDSDMNKTIQMLSRRGFVLGESQKALGSRLFLGVDKNKWVEFDSLGNSLRYFNGAIGDLSKLEADDSKKLKDSADKVVKDLIGAESANYVLKNTEEDYRATPNSLAMLVNKTFRYVKNIDGRLVEGTTCHLRITIAQNCQVKAIEYKNPDIIKDKGIQSKVKRSGLKRQIQEYFQSADFQNLSPGTTNVTIQDATKSLVLDSLGGDKYLTPSTSFYVTGNSVDNDSLKREIILKEDADQTPNLLQGEIQRFVPSGKK